MPIFKVQDASRDPLLTVPYSTHLSLCSNLNRCPYVRDIRKGNFCTQPRRPSQLTQASRLDGKDRHVFKMVVSRLPTIQLPVASTNPPTRRGSYFYKPGNGDLLPVQGVNFEAYAGAPPIPADATCCNMQTVNDGIERFSPLVLSLASCHCCGTVHQTIHRTCG
jgi:hypothetical protein